MEELKNTFVQYDKYIKSIIDEKKHFQKGDRANYLNQTSKMSSQQKSQIMKTEEKMLKITLQQFINFDEKNKKFIMRSDSDTKNVIEFNVIKSTATDFVLESKSDNKIVRAHLKS